MDFVFLLSNKGCLVKSILLIHSSFFLLFGSFVSEDLLIVLIYHLPLTIMLEITQIAFEMLVIKIITTPLMGESHNLQATYRLNGGNYLKWPSIVWTFLREKEC